MNNNCANCSKQAEIICFCNQVHLCSGCIGHHLLTSTSGRHKPVSLSDTHLKSLLQDSWQQLLSSEEEILAQTAARHELLSAMQTKIKSSIKEVEEFQDKGVQLVTEAVRTTERKLLSVAEELSMKVIEKCASVKKQLREAMDMVVKGDFQLNQLADTLSSCQNAQEIMQYQVLSKSMNFHQIDFESILTKAFEFNISLQKENAASREVPKPVVCQSPDNLSPVRPDTKSHTLTSTSFAFPESKTKIRRREEPRSSVQNPVRSASKSSKSDSRIPIPVRTPKQARSPIGKRSLRFSLVCFTPEAFSLFNAQTSELEHRSLSNKDLGHEGSSWVLTSEGVIVSTGGLNPSPKRSTWLYQVTSGSISIGPPMRVARCYHASVSLGDFVYVTGGLNSVSLKECERFSVSGKTWQKVANLNVARHLHSATVWNSRIYVIGGYENNQVEVFDPQKNKFKLLGVGLSLSGGNISFAQESELLIIGRRILSLNLYTEQIEQWQDTEQEDWWTPTSPLVCSNSAFFVSNSRVYEYNLVRKQLSVLSSLSH